MYITTTAMLYNDYYVYYIVFNVIHRSFCVLHFSRCYTVGSSQHLFCRRHHVYYNKTPATHRF